MTDDPPPQPPAAPPPAFPASAVPARITGAAADAPTETRAPTAPATVAAPWGELARVPAPARWLGLAGLLPVAACAAVVWLGGDAARFTALALAHGYAALILSFLGGMWWGLAARAPSAAGWTYAVAVAPSLLALATFVPWAIGAAWPVPSLVALALAFWFSPLIDRRLEAAGLVPDWWMGLRWPLSIGLAVLTLLAALRA